MTPRQHYPIQPMAAEHAFRSQRAVEPILTRPARYVRLVDPGFVPLLQYGEGDRGWRRVAPMEDADLRAEIALLPPDEETPREAAQRRRREKENTDPEAIAKRRAATKRAWATRRSPAAEKAMVTKAINAATRSRAAQAHARTRRKSA
jgi:hypothetical protein